MSEKSAPSMRAQLEAALQRDLVGPAPEPRLSQENGQEILVDSPPRLRYAAGILFPRATPPQLVEDGEEAQLELPFEAASVDFEGSERVAFEEEFSEDEPVNLSNALLPSALGFSCYGPPSAFTIHVGAGRYKAKDVTVEVRGTPKIKRGFWREAIDWTIELTPADLPPLRSAKSWAIVSTGLVLWIHRRATDSGGSFWTFSLVNDRQLPQGHERLTDEDCFFQVSLQVGAPEGFRPLPPGRATLQNSEHEDARSARLLYRNHHTFAIGHGCAATWKSEGQSAHEIRSEILPRAEIKPIVPAQFAGLNFSMRDLAEGRADNQLVELCRLYEQWINAEAGRAAALSGELRQTADEHLENCRHCLGRMRDGVHLLQSDARVRRAFSLMNRAMLWQQMHSRQPLRNWKTNAQANLSIEPWQRPDESAAPGAWRPFQIAFLLMNLPGSCGDSSPDRALLDLIWFPTGGGKTEAYLGLSAFTILWARLCEPQSEGTQVLMRYTLRLLTAQQYQRAAALICACEKLRRDNPAELGASPITIGLWVGSAATPNTRKDAVEKLRKLDKGDKENPFVVLKCPWCGAAMGPVPLGKSAKVRGYREKSGPLRVAFQCHDTACDFSSDAAPLPLLVVDEDIYAYPPSLLLGTVDKFALLPWKPEARSLFGWRESDGQSYRVAAPRLIVQDELHLISGPLGSMVGHYETLIGELCRDGQNRLPKIIASTATISRAREQCHALFNCGRDSIRIFPPPGLEAGDSFFAQRDDNAPGRWYLGVQGVAQKAVQLQVRVLATLAQEAKIAIASPQERNYYWTILCYFNSLRELGHAASLIGSSVHEYLNRIAMRYGLSGDKERRRYINHTVELTSRVPSFQIPGNLQALEINYPSPSGAPSPMDICLATNMVSVGLDVGRLGLMVMTGQPKTTAEYIQATSRVGREEAGPGLVVVLYNSGRPRDRSHYERFCAYHTALYREVEPTSVTPFAAPVRERALHALLVGYLRAFGDGATRGQPSPVPPDALFEAARKCIEARVRGVDNEETEATLRLLEERAAEWLRRAPGIYGSALPQPGEVPLLFAAGQTPPDDWRGRVWPTPTSLRDVDASCEAYVPGGYPQPPTD
jgi:hypothetical protein